jgi:chromosome segregation protein
LLTAEAALKRATVKAKDWTEARDKVQAIEQSLAEVKTKFEALERERVRLERIRRVAPSLRAYTDNSQQLTAMGEVAVLPANAAKLLGDTESDVAVAKAQQDISRKLADETRAKRNAISFNVDVIRDADAIESLAERRQQTTFHERDIGKRELEIDGLWKGVQAAIRQLGWAPTNEETLEAKLPPLPVRRTIAGLIKQHGSLARTLDGGYRGRKCTKRREIATTRANSSVIRSSLCPLSAGITRCRIETRRPSDGDHAGAEQGSQSTTRVPRCRSRIGRMAARFGTLRRLALPAR